MVSTQASSSGYQVPNYIEAIQPTPTSIFIVERNLSDRISIRYKDKSGDYHSTLRFSSRFLIVPHVMQEGNPEENLCLILVSYNNPKVFFSVVKLTPPNQWKLRTIQVEGPVTIIQHQESTDLSTSTRTIVRSFNGRLFWIFNKSMYIYISELVVSPSLGMYQRGTLTLCYTHEGPSRALFMNVAPIEDPIEGSSLEEQNTALFSLGLMYEETVQTFYRYLFRSYVVGGSQDEEIRAAETMRTGFSRPSMLASKYKEDIDFSRYEPLGNIWLLKEEFNVLITFPQRKGNLKVLEDRDVIFQDIYRNSSGHRTCLSSGINLISMDGLLYIERIWREYDGQKITIEPFSLEGVSKIKSKKRYTSLLKYLDRKKVDTGAYLAFLTASGAKWLKEQGKIIGNLTAGPVHVYIHAQEAYLIISINPKDKPEDKLYFKVDKETLKKALQYKRNLAEYKKEHPVFDLLKRLSIKKG